MSAVPRVSLAPGYEISAVLKGGWQLAGGHGAVDHDRALDDMRLFVEAGVTTFDCADIYTGVERLIGDFLERERRERGAASVRDVRVHTKYVPDRSELARLTKGDVSRAVDRSLRRLRVERLDLVQLHWWDYDVPGCVQTALWLAELARAGKIDRVGATNFDTPHLAELLDAGVPLISHQVQHSLLDARPEGAMSELCAARGVGLLGYGALAGGFLSERWLGAPAPAEPLENRSLVKYRLVIEEWGGWALFQQLLDALCHVARRHETRIGAIAVRWVLDRPGVRGVIVGARGAQHLDSTLDALRVRLDDEDRRRIGDVVARARGPAGDVYGLERVKDGPHAAIMKYELNSAAGD